MLYRVYVAELESRGPLVGEGGSAVSLRVPSVNGLAGGL